MRQTRTRTYVGMGGGLVASAALCALLAACGSPGGAVNAAGASATATCPPQPAFKVVIGTISATGISAASTGTITVTASDGTQTHAHLTPATRVTRIVVASVSDLTSGATVLVTTDANATSAKQIALVNAPAGGFGGPGGYRGTPGARRTPPAGVNAACFQRAVQGQGQERGAPGLRGIVTTVTSTQLVVDDTQGQTLTLAITPSTAIVKNAPGTTANLTIGATVSVTGRPTSDGIDAQAIVVQAAAK
jgi:hypothetical protein